MILQVAPGDVVELSGIFLPIPYTGFRAMRAGLIADTYLEAMSVTHFKKKYEEWDFYFLMYLLKLAWWNGLNFLSLYWILIIVDASLRVKEVVD